MTTPKAQHAPGRTHVAGPMLNPEGHRFTTPYEVTETNGPAFVASCGDEATAHEVSRRWNSHAALVAALTRIESAPRFTDSHSPYFTFNEDDMTAIRAALAAARGEA